MGMTSPPRRNLDRWARGARVYDEVVSPASTTESSHASMFTGLLPSQHGTDADQRWLAEEFETVAESLQSAGYRTYLWSANPHVSAAENFQQGFDRVEHPWDPDHRDAAKQILDRKVADDRSTELYRRIARGLVASVGDQGRGRARERFLGELARGLGPGSPMVRRAQLHGSASAAGTRARVSGARHVRRGRGGFLRDRPLLADDLGVFGGCARALPERASSDGGNVRRRDRGTRRALCAASGLARRNGAISTIPSSY